MKTIDQKALIGKWEAYKRVNRNGPSDITDFNTIIKNVEFNIENDVLTGFFKAGGTATFLYELKSISDGWLIVLNPEKKQFKFKILAQTEREWVFEGNNDIIYYMYRK